MFGLHPASLAQAVTASRMIYERYFRVESRGAQNIPASGPTIVVANHGGVLPVDGAMLALDLARNTEPARIPRMVADHFVPRLPLVSTLFARLGVVSGTRANVRRLLERGELVVIFPEGVSGPAKPYAERYKLQHWRVGFAELAMRHRAVVVPAAIIGAEESWPVAARLRGVRLFGSPYLPIPASPIPLPVRYHIGYGAPIELAGDPESPAAVTAAANHVFEALDTLIAWGRTARNGAFR
ncbi:MAG: lysophospholipid acyltransferase family protein [Kofleriaceae bacterium]